MTKRKVQAKRTELQGSWKWQVEKDSKEAKGLSNSLESLLGSPWRDLSSHWPLLHYQNSNAVTPCHPCRFLFLFLALSRSTIRRSSFIRRTLCYKWVDNVDKYFLIETALFLLTTFLSLYFRCRLFFLMIRLFKSFLSAVTKRNLFCQSY